MENNHWSELTAKNPEYRDCETIGDKIVHNLENTLWTYIPLRVQSVRAVWVVQIGHGARILHLGGGRVNGGLDAIRKSADRVLCVYA